ncbi:MAG: hypothetical protein ABJA37_15660 [Ferruginibacter sp.]
MTTYNLKKHFSKPFLFVISILAFFSCQKQIEDNLATAPPTAPIGTRADLGTKVIAASIAGFVTNENNAPVVNASVKVGATIITTDKYGYFETKNTEVVKNAALITVTKNGYFKGIKTYIAETGKSAFFRIKLIPKANTGSFNASAGGTVTTSTGVKIIFPAGVIVNAVTSAAYTGNVAVSAYWINPTSDELNKIMPGDLRAIDKDGNIKALATYGMAAVELTGNSGELLQIAPDKKATLTIPIPASIAGTAPSSIPLWYFDESNGLWKEEGSATKVGNEYTGAVSHFSFWNCDISSNYIQLSLTLKNAAGNPLQFIPVKISLVSNPQRIAYGYTDSSGYVAGVVPDNEQLKLDILTECNISLYTQTFSTTNTNLSLGIITVNPQAVATSTIMGSVTNCNNTAVTNGYVVMIASNTSYRYSLSNTGTFNFTHLLCNGPENADFFGEDISTSVRNTTAINSNIVAGNNVVPTIQACGTTINTRQFIYWSINGVMDSIPNLTDTTAHNQNFGSNILIQTSTGTALFTIAFNTVNIAANTAQQLVTFRPDQRYPSYGMPGQVLVNMTEYGAVGQYFSGNFAGTLTATTPPYNNTNVPVTCSFRIKRRF